MVKNSSISNGSINFYNMMKRILSFPCKRIRDISLPVVERNAFFAHPENILLGMLGSEDEEIRRLGVNKVLSFRKEIPRYNINPDYENGRTQEEIETQSGIRKFQVPKININADVFYRMVDVDDISVQEPPLLKHLSTHDIENIRSVPLKLGHPCHNQKVERHIKLVSEASGVVTTFERRDGLIRQKIKSRKLMKSFDSKSSFTEHLE